MTVKEDLRSFGAKFKLDSHHNIERFGITFIAITSIMVLLLTAAFVSAQNRGRQLLDDQALYVSSFTTSRTNLSGEVPGIFVSPERDRALVLMKFKSPTDVSSDASSYQGFITGSNADLGQTRIEEEIRGEIIVFGSSGYLGVVLETDQSFPQQILSLTMRANSELVYEKGDANIRKDLRDDKSFLEYDQWRIYFNPGGAQAQVVEALASPKLNVGAMYAELVTAPAETKVRDAMNEVLLQMRADLERIDAYETELGVTSSLDGDKLVNPRGDNPQEALIPIAGDEIVGGVDQEAQSDDGSTLSLRTEWVNPRGFDFDWRNGSVYEGYLDEVVPMGQKYGEYLAARSEQDGGTFNASDIVWSLSDGRLLVDAVNTSTATVMQPLVTLRTNLESAYSQYFKDKSDYQVKYPLELLSLEITLRNVETTYSVNSDADAVLVY